MTTSLTKLTLAAAALAMLMPAFAWAQPQETKAKKQALSSYVLRGAIDGATVKTKGGNAIGDVDELIVDTKTNQVVFAIVSTGGFLGIGDQLTAIPFELLQWVQAKDDVVLCCDISKKNLEMAPKFEHDRLSEHLANEQWRNETRGAFGTYPKDAVITPPAAPDKARPDNNATVASIQDRPALNPDRWRKAGDMVEAKVVAGNGSDGGQAKNESFGDVDDLIIHRESRKVVAVIVSCGGVAGISKKLFVIPCAALEQTEKTNRHRVNRSIDEMKKAPVLEKPVLARLENKEYRAGLAEFYGVTLDK